ncbi:MAG: decarboxylating 6-phosphogluconate dehydrogenase [bacterium]|nr:decarboxylating 6-phosphogluconate dehydrogenase [bacterium]MDT8366888.1 decarboxylating 6-phosphogluconate dehydrogenase [bacterium]
MQIAMLGLGRMGMNMARRLLGGGHDVIGFNRTRDKTDELVKEGGTGAYSLEEVVSKLEAPRTVWIMLPAGKPVDDTISQLKGLLDPGDTIIEGGNSYYKDDIRRAGELAPAGIAYVDAGVSGGIWGLKLGYCTMVGGPRERFDHLEPVFKTLAPEEGYLYCGPTGAGHFVKMVHNGIEYGMMQAYGEGFEILEASEYGPALDYSQVSHLWNQGSVIRSWLLELAEEAFKNDARLDEITGHVDDSGEGRWTVQQAIDTSVPAPVITLSLFARFRSRQDNSFSNRVLAALRREFGGHAVKKK